MTGQLEGKVALVTGGNAGIGRAAVLAYAREGARVVIAARRVADGEETVEEVRRAGGEAVFVKTDVSQAAEVEEMVKKSVELYGRLDYAFNNAGVGGDRGPMHEQTEESWDDTININLKGLWLCMKYEITQMLQQGGGAIVNNSSGGGLVGFAGSWAYGASKHGVVGLTRIGALDYAQQGIRVNAVCPGHIRTPLSVARLAGNPELEKRLKARAPMGRGGTTEEVAEAVVWLCSDAASYITGVALSIDGGYVAG